MRFRSAILKLRYCQATGIARWVVIVAAIALVLETRAAEPSLEQPARKPITSWSSTNAHPVTVGMEGRFDTMVAGPVLEPKPVTERTRVIVRIADTRPHGTLNRYDLRYVGLEPGQYDLRDYLIRPDGSSATNLDPMPVRIIGMLSKDHQGQLQEQSIRGLALFGGYRGIVIGLGVIWALCFIPLFLLRSKTRRVVKTQRAPAPPSIVERLRPLVEDAVTGRITADGQARLELLLLSYWRTRLNLAGQDYESVLAALHAHPEAGKLFRHLEEWLHRPPGLAKVDVGTLLRPYRELPLPESTPLISSDTTHR